MREPFAAACTSPAASLLLLVLLAELALLIFGLFGCLQEHRPGWHAGVLAAACAVVFAHALQATNGMLLRSRGMSLGSAAAPLFDAPMGWYVLLALLVALLLAGEVAAAVRWRAGHITPSAVKEALDNLPQGICFARANGTVELSNLAMAKRASALGCAPLLDAAALWDAACAAGEPAGESVLVRMAHDEAWLYSREKLAVTGEERWQLTAVDVSEQYRLTAQLERQTERLREHQAELKAYAKNAVQVIRAEEVLEAKMAVHDELGELLLTTGYVLDRAGGFDAQALVVSWRRLIERVLRGAFDDPDSAPAGDQLSALIARTALELGVSVTLSGALPPADSVAYDLLVSAVRTCASNACEHAHAANVYVVLMRDGYSARITNDGAPPQAQVREAGGLRSLRQRVEAAGGSMRTSSSPRFELALELPS